MLLIKFCGKFCCFCRPFAPKLGNQLNHKEFKLKSELKRRKLKNQKQLQRRKPGNQRILQCCEISQHCEISWVANSPAKMACPILSCIVYYSFAHLTFLFSFLYFFPNSPCNSVGFVVFLEICNEVGHKSTQPRL